ncbi:MAG TPA: UDP-N-acetylmuramoyl-L-alanyl-D-glutamate--2,6-diaminopimelate ligase [Bacteroidales bacterium]|nr:UDP-N-acetylmuramoyl-L-alanyl-D-glutamate--2,6-diaminopimelate ligase [Bacteroidales bacterium]
MSLYNILEGVKVISFTGNTEKKISNIVFDSRKTEKNSLFVAVRGSKTDGHDYIHEALYAGATAVVCERLPDRPDPGITWIVTDDSAKALGQLSSNFFGNPSRLLKLVGITGTNGKTTIATLLYRLFTGLGYKCGLFSTVCNYVDNRELPATHTTPDPVQLNSIMAQMTNEGCDYAFMEVSSHALDQQRTAGLVFAGGIFTNLTHDHLDYHKTFDNYLAAKKSFFDLLPSDAFALVNAEDRNSSVMLQNCKARHYTFSTRGMADFRCSIIEESFEGMGLRIMGNEVWTRFIGDYNASNLLAVYSASELLKAKKPEILTLISDLKPVPGRLEVIRIADITGIVDYAHTPDALVNVLDTINRIREGNIKLITVIGAGGDRDKTKRPIMAAIAAERSTKLILTSDNPRTEDPEKILDDMETGIDPGFVNKTLRISNRREAVKTAVMLAEKGDVILVAGKGHETYQEIMGTRHHFDDREELRNALANK